MKTLLTVGLGMLLLLMESVWAAAGIPGDQVRQTADKLLANPVIESYRIEVDQ